MSVRPITEDDLNLYVDGRLDHARHTEVAAYLDAHPDVARRVQGFRDQRDRLRAALQPVVEEPIPSELDLRRLIAERHPAPSGPDAAARGRRAGARVAGGWMRAAAALVLLCVGALGGWSLRGMGAPAVEGVGALAREAAASYAVYAPDRLHPVEIRADDRAALDDWMAARLGRAVAIPDLAPSGYRFMGGRIVPTEHGPAVLLMYDDDKGTRLALLTRPMRADRDAPMSAHGDGEVNGVTWADAGLGYSLVGPKSADTLHPLADEARRQILGAV
ncbi:anti-sigma factor family protein [Acuticoccus sediminis]|uniref:anti-sigma factor family protein n=1 Tax=Acuticoccus sediminis TaxID=2184697 RepID=UPI001CFF0C42|nr:anti-sigma factor [Acuticoccus sediminis]